MSIILKIFLMSLLLFQLILIIRTVKLKKLSIKYCSFWILLLILMGIVVIFPNLIFILSKLLGFETSSNMIFLLGFFFLFYVIFVLTMSLSIQNEKIKLLIQEVSIMKEKERTNGKQR